MARTFGDSDFTNINAAICFKIAGTQVVSTQMAAVTKPGAAVGGNQDAGIVANAMVNYVNTLATKINSIIDVLNGHGLTA